MKEWLPEGHLSYFVSDLVDGLDLSRIYASYERETRGAPPFHPAMLTKIIFYGLCRGVFSSRKLSLATHEDVAFRMLAAGNHPDFRTISEFRKRHLKSLADLFIQALKLCAQAGLVSMKHIAIDGTKPSKKGFPEISDYAAAIGHMQRAPANAPAVMLKTHMTAKGPFHWPPWLGRFGKRVPRNIKARSDGGRGAHMEPG